MRLDQCLWRPPGSRRPVGDGGTGVDPSSWTGQGFRLGGSVAEMDMAAFIIDFCDASCGVDIDVRRKRKALAVGRPGRVNDGPDTCGPIGRGGYQVMGSARGPTVRTPS